MEKTIKVDKKLYFVIFISLLVIGLMGSYFMYESYKSGKNHISCFIKITQGDELPSSTSTLVQIADDRICEIIFERRDEYYYCYFDYEDDGIKYFQC